MTEAARAAQAIRKELKAAFPTVKFSVRSENYSGGNSVSIGYEDGPLTDSVNAIVAKYEYGSFDGMTDMYTIDNNRDDIPQAKYVMVNRHMSKETGQKIRAKIIKDFGIENPEDEKSWMNIFHCWPQQVIFREFSKTAM